MRKISESMLQEEREELWGSLIDVVEDWLEERGFTPYDFPNDDRNFPMNPDEAIIYGDDYDILADGFARVIGIDRDNVDGNEKSGMGFWAEKEVEIACKKEKPDRKDGEWDYGCACYESALKAYNSLLEDGHSGFSIGITKNILNRLIDCKPLTPIEDTDDVWNEIADISGLRGEVKNYQCKRMSSLCKYVYPDGTVKYRDLDRAIGVVDFGEGETRWYSGLVSDIVDELFPITMPYMPEDKSYEVYCEEFLYDKDNGRDYDTESIRYLIKPDGTRVNIYRYFAEKENGFVEISQKEYYARKEYAKMQSKQREKERTI